MTKPRKDPPWLLRAATALLAFVFAMPACMTANLWRDDRIGHEMMRAEVPALRVFRMPDASGGFVLQLPRDVAKHLHDVLPEIAAEAEWLLVQPLEHTNTAATMLAMAATKGLMGTSLLELTVVEEPSASSSTLSLRSRYFHYHDSPLGEVVPHLPGFQKRTMLYTTYELDIACRATELAARPDDLGEPLEAFALTHQQMDDNGTPVIVRLAWTPLALLFDVLFSPFELLWFFTA